MEKQELIEILNLHEKWLNNEASGKRANFENMNLAEINFNGADLRKAILRDTNLWKADLHGTNLWWADMENADLREAKLNDANMREVNLRNSILWETNLRRAILHDADLEDAEFLNADLYHSDLRKANLSGTDFWGANLNGADFSEAKINETFLLPHLYILKMQPQNTRIHAWKYSINGKSPFRDSEYKVGKTYTEHGYLADERVDCGEGINVATLQWCIHNSENRLDYGRDKIEFMEIEFMAKDIIAIPYATDGKFRVKKIKIIRKISKEEARQILNGFIK